MKHCEANPMNRMSTISWWAGLVPVCLCLSILLPSGISQAGGFTSPKECQSFAGDDHLNCLYSAIERQQKHNDTVQSERKAQQDRLEQLGAGRTPADEHTAVAGEHQGETVDRNDIPQAAPAPPSPSETMMTPVMGSPVECRAYSGAAHVNCLYAYIEIQRSKAGQVEEELNTQKHMLEQLREQVDRQAAASQNLQRRLNERDTVSSLPSPAYIAPPIFPGYAYPGYGYLGYGYPGYGYPAPGLSLYLGVPGYYWGLPFYGPRFLGPRFYGHHRR
jgi:hypothetical protein